MPCGPSRHLAVACGFGALDHLGLTYSDTEVQKIGWQLESFRTGGFEEAATALRQKYLDRMHDIPTFVKELKQRFYPSFAGLSRVTSHHFNLCRFG